MILASISYAAGSLFSQHKLGDSSGLLVSTASVLWGTLVILPFGIAQGPGSVPAGRRSSRSPCSALLGTALGLLMYLRLLADYGSSRGLVVYLLPVVAPFYGAVFLDEPLRVTALVGLALILAGVAIASGLVGRSAASSRFHFHSLTVEGDVRLRRATGDDVDFVVGLLNEEDTAPFLAASRSRAGPVSRTWASTENRATRSLRDRGARRWRLGPRGMMEFSLENRVDRA